MYSVFEQENKYIAFKAGTTKKANYSQVLFFL